MLCGHYSTTCCVFKNAFQENKLNEEIDWGIGFRKNRIQEKDILLAQEPSELFSSSAKKKKRKKKKVPKVTIPPICRAEKRRLIVTRSTATLKQYMKMLAVPRRCDCAEHAPKPKTPSRPCTPRCCQLALPRKIHVYYTWKQYYHVLSQEQVEWLKELLHKVESLKPLDAYNYFKKLAKAERRRKRLRRRRNRRRKKEKPKKSKIVHEIKIIAKKIINFFANKSKQKVKCSHIFLSNLMKAKLEENNLIMKGHKRNNLKDICGLTLYDTLDQLAVWMESNIGFDDEPSDEEPSEESSISSFTYSDISSAEEEEVGEEVGDEYAAIEEMLEEEFEYEETFEDLISVREKKIAFEEAEEEPDLDWILEIKQQDVESSRQFDDRIEESEEMPIVAIESKPEVEKEEEEAEEEIEAEAEAEEVEEEVEVEEEEVEEEGEEEEEGDHVPDTVCCVTMKIWATWLVDVAQNTHAWCQWIQEVIAKIRYFAAVLKGEIMTPDGRVRVLYKEEWDQFTATLSQDIESWQKYKTHVKELSESIIKAFKGKKIICCSACLRNRLIVNQETAYQVTQQLVEALNNTTYWRNWLDAIVEEAKKIAVLKFDLPEASESGSIEGVTAILDSLSSSYDSSSYVFELIELKSPSQSSKEPSLLSGSSFMILEQAKSKESIQEPPPEEEKPKKGKKGKKGAKGGKKGKGKGKGKK